MFEEHASNEYVGQSATASTITREVRKLGTTLGDFGCLQIPSSKPSKQPATVFTKLLELTSTSCL